MHFVVFAQEDAKGVQSQTVWLSAGLNWGNYFNGGTGIGDFYSVAIPGLNFSLYGFWNQKNIGFFSNVGIMFPVIYYNETNYDPVIQADYSFGVGFSHKINKTLNLHFGVGPNSNLYSLSNEEALTNVRFDDTRFEFGIGGDIVLRYKLIDTLYIDFGTTVSYDFIAYHRVIKSISNNGATTTEESGRWINHLFFGIRPYIALSSNLSRTR
jgi:hypothetical protein